MPAADRYSIEDLATLGGVSRRTVRYSVQERLIPEPLGRGRGNHYGEPHLAQLLRVKAMQESGLTLEDIRRALAAPSNRPRKQAHSARRAGSAALDLAANGTGSRCGTAHRQHGAAPVSGEAARARRVVPRQLRES